MGELVSALGRHGYAALAAVVFLEAIGFPVPAAIALVAAGAASAAHSLRPDVALLAAVSAMLLGDTLLYLLGRHTGWWLLGILCRVALNPETCILRSAESFYRRGRVTLVIAKFLPGINTMAPPLAGSMNMRLGQFLRLDLAGALLYAVAFGAVGFLFSSLVERIVHGVETLGGVVKWALIAGIVAYIGYRAYVYWKHRKYRVVPRVQVDEVAAKLASNPELVIVADVRSHGYYNPGALRIKDSIRLEPNKLADMMHELPREKEIYLYCT